VGGLSAKLVRELREDLDLERGIETGTFRGGGARLLGSLFPEVASIELSPALHEAAAAAVADMPHVRLLQGDSREWLPRLVDPSKPTLYFLDGHWSGGVTAGEESECPVMDELRAIAGGHPDDCIVIDDARHLAAPPPPPHDPSHWPDLVEVLDLVRAIRPDHHVTVLHDQIIGVPARARGPVDEFGRTAPQEQPPVVPTTRFGRIAKGLARRL
jgi:hypothetical protein